MKNKIYYLIPLVLAIILGVLSYFYVPVKGYDLFEYYSWMDKMLFFNPINLLNYIFYRAEFLIMSYFYLMALIGNKQLVQVFPTILFYFIIFYMIFDYVKVKKCDKKCLILIIVLFLALFKYISAVSCLRYTLAFSIFALGLYLEYIKEKKGLYKLLYIIPIFIHTSSFVLLIFRILQHPWLKKFRYLLIAMLCIVVFFPKIPIKILDALSFIPYTSFISNRMKFYLLGEYVAMNRQYLFRIIQTASILVLIILNKFSKKSEKNKNYYDIYLMIGLFTIIVAPFYTLFIRLSDLLLFLASVIVIDLYKDLPSYPKFFQIAVYIALLGFIAAGIKIQIPIFEDMFF